MPANLEYTEQGSTFSCLSTTFLNAPHSYHFPPWCRTNGDAIIGKLQSRIDAFKTERIFHFNWTSRLFLNAPKMAPEDINFTDEELAQMEDVVKDKARARLEEFCNVPTFFLLWTLTNMFPCHCHSQDWNKKSAAG
jgi:hypothetical protein